MPEDSNTPAPDAKIAPSKQGGKRSPAPPPAMTDAQRAEIDDKVKEIEARCIKAREDLAAWFGPERWPRIQTQAANTGLSDDDLTSLCGSLVMTRAEWELVKGMPKAALILAALHLLMAVGSRPSEADETALFEAVKQEMPAA